MSKAVFRPSLKARIVNAILVAGLLVVVYAHWNGQRHTELIIFLVLTVLALSLFTLRGEVSLDAARREFTAKRLWLFWAVRNVVFRVGINDELFLEEDIIRHNRGTGFNVVVEFRVTGQVVSKSVQEPPPYIVISEEAARNKAALVAFVEQAAQALRLPLNDNRKHK